MGMRISKADEAKVLALAGLPTSPAARKRRPPPSVVTKSCLRWSLTVSLPCRVISEANRCDHWSVKRRRSEVQQMALHLAVDGFYGKLQHWHDKHVLTVTWTHIGQVMDGDNLQRAFKALRDHLARTMCVDDGDPAIEWRYDQRTGENGVELKIETR